MDSFGGMVKGGCLPDTGEWMCSNCGKTGSTRYSCYRCGFLGGGQGHSNAGPGKGGGGQNFQGQAGIGAGMSGMRIVGRNGRDHGIPRIDEAMVVGRGWCLVLGLALVGTG